MSRGAALGHAPRLQLPHDRSRSQGIHALWLREHKDGSLVEIVASNRLITTKEPVANRAQHSDIPRIQVS